MAKPKFTVGQQVKTKQGDAGKVAWVSKTCHAKFGWTYGVMLDGKTKETVGFEFSFAAA